MPKSSTKRPKAPDFLEALDHVIGIVTGQNVALMYAEEDPLHCRRFLLICPALLQRGIVPLHLKRGGSGETQRDAEDRLLELNGFAGVTSNSLFSQGRAAAAIGTIRFPRFSRSHRIFLSANCKCSRVEIVCGHEIDSASAMG